MICEAAIATVAPPIEPSHDFLGDILGNNRCLPNKQPMQYAPVSFAHKKMNIESGNIGVYAIPRLLVVSGWNARIFNVAKGNAMYN